MFTLGENWIDHYLTGMFLLHTLLGRDTAVRPRTPPTPEILLQVLAEVVAGNYHQEVFFVPGAAPKRSLTAVPPVLDPHQKYELISLNAVTERNQKVSVTAGGIAFEDPLWAILSAHALSPYNRGGKAGLPIASSNDGLWSAATEAVNAIEAGKYAPGRFFHRIDGFNPPESKPVFNVIVAEASKIEALRARGLQTLPVANVAKYFELYLK